MHTEFEQAGSQPLGVVDKELGVADVVFVRELQEKQFRHNDRPGREQPDMEDVARIVSTAE